MYFHYLKNYYTSKNPLLYIDQKIIWFTYIRRNFLLQLYFLRKSHWFPFTSLLNVSFIIFGNANSSGSKTLNLENMSWNAMKIRCKECLSYNLSINGFLEAKQYGKIKKVFFLNVWIWNKFIRPEVVFRISSTPPRSSLVKYILW